MTSHQDASTRLLAGATAVVRDVYGGKIRYATPHLVAYDADEGLVLCLRPGTQLLAPTTWIDWLRTGDAAVRLQDIPNQLAGKWDLDSWTWRDTVMLRHYIPGEYFSVSQFHDAEGRFASWYVNFELPYQRTSIGLDTFDLMVDMAVEPDLSRWSWKDEDEYAHGRRLGLIPDPLHRRIDEARQRSLEVVESGTGPSAGDPAKWRHDPQWALPELPADAMSVPTSTWPDVER